jgi:ABC-type glutathione transport system ATPase component
MPAPPERRRGNGKKLEIRGARAFNLKGFDVRFPLGTLCVVSGVSGSGKSTLVNRILQPLLAAKLEREGPNRVSTTSVSLGLAHVDDLVAIDAAPIGRTPRSNPATYTGVFDVIRDLFAALPERRCAATQVALLVQRRRRPLRGVRRRGREARRAAVPRAGDRALRRVRGRALPSRDARRALPRKVDRRRARDDRRGGARALQGPSEDRAAAGR